MKTMKANVGFGNADSLFGLGLRKLAVLTAILPICVLLLAISGLAACPPGTWNLGDITGGPQDPYPTGAGVITAAGNINAAGTYCVPCTGITIGDGGTNSVQNPAHAFMAAGQFVVSLIVTDNDGADSVQSASKTITLEAPTQVVLYSCYPNPASTQATIVYTLPTGASSPVLRIFDLVGRLVRQVDLNVAQTTYVWNLASSGGAALPNGLYFCVITAQDANKSQTFKLLIDR